MPTIHPTAIIDPTVELAADVTVGPYALIHGRVTVGSGTTIDAHSIIRGACTIGSNCRIGPAAWVGLEPQHLGFKGGETWTVIGDDVVIREGACVHRSTHEGLDHATRVGNNCFLMTTSHVGHDSVLDEHVTLASGVQLGGHVTVGARAFIGGGAVVHQFCRIGRIAMVRGNDSLSKDAPPFAVCLYNLLKGYNLVGCKRAGLPMSAVRGIRDAYRCIHAGPTVPAAVAAIHALKSPAQEVAEILEFIATSKRGIMPSIKIVKRPVDTTVDEV